MAKRRLAALFLAIGIAIVVPAIALAASSAGLVPCGVSSSQNVATECQACNIVQLIQELITFLIGLSVPIAMAMFAYAGFLYFTSGAGGTENISKAKGIFKNSVIGFALVLCSWLIVNTILYTVISSTYFQGSSWFQVKCETRDPGSQTIGGVILSHLGVAPTVTAPTYNSAGVVSNCPADYQEETIPSTDTTTCVPDSGDGADVAPTYQQVSPQGVGNCSASALAGTWGSNATAMSCIAQKESACGADPYSGVDLTTNGQPISIGEYQINLSANKIECGNSAPLNCPSAFSGTYTGKNKSVTVTNQALYSQCEQAALNDTCNTQTAVSIYNTQGIKAWGTASSCGY